MSAIVARRWPHCSPTHYGISQGNHSIFDLDSVGRSALSISLFILAIINGASGGHEQSTGCLARVVYGAWSTMPHAAVLVGGGPLQAVPLCFIKISSLKTLYALFSQKRLLPSIRWALTPLYRICRIPSAKCSLASAVCCSRMNIL